MDESFPIEILHNGKEYSFAARLVTTGYTHKFYVAINGIEVIYEPDEERNYRAILKEQNPGVKDNDAELIKAVGLKLNQPGIETD